MKKPVVKYPMPGLTLKVCCYADFPVFAMIKCLLFGIFVANPKNLSSVSELVIDLDLSKILQSIAEDLISTHVLRLHAKILYKTVRVAVECVVSIVIKSLSQVPCFVESSSGDVQVHRQLLECGSCREVKSLKRNVRLS